MNGIGRMNSGVTVSPLLQGINRNSKIGETALTSDRAREIRRGLADIRQDDRKKNQNQSGAGAILSNLQSYGDSIRAQRQKSKDTSLSLKTLKYQFKDLSSKIIRSKTSANARQVAAQASREVLRLKRAKQSGEYDSEEIDAAIAHAKAMERVAKKKVKHLLEEEMAKAAGGPCDGETVEPEEEEAKEAVEEPDEEITGETGEETAGEIAEGTAAGNAAGAIGELPLSEATGAGRIEVVTEEELAELEQEMLAMIEEFTSKGASLLELGFEELGLDELNDSLEAAKGDMDPEDLKMMKIKHRNREMKDIVKADAAYLKARFEYLEKLKSAGIVPGLNLGGGGTVTTTPVVSAEAASNAVASNASAKAACIPAVTMDVTTGNAGSLGAVTGGTIDITL